MMTSFRFFATTLVLLSLTSAAHAQLTTGGIGGSTGSTGIGGSTGSTGSTGAIGGATGTTGSTATTATTANSVTLGSNAAQTFVGANATQGFVGGATATNNQQRSNRQFQALQNNNQQRTQQATGTPRSIKTTLKVSFAFPSAPQLITAGRMANANVPSMNRFVPQRPELAGIDVNLTSNGLAVLTGSTSNEETRRLAANLMRIQPGVRKVDNQVVVQAE